MKSFSFLLVAAFAFGMPARAFAQSVQWAQGYPKTSTVSGKILVKGSVTLGLNKLTSPTVKVYTWRKNDNNKGALVSDVTLMDRCQSKVVTEFVAR